VPQLHLYLSQEKAEEVKRRAAAKGMSVSAYLSEIVDKDLTGQWPAG
jgi:predicted DNA binding CopG/RHH family protein